MKQDQLVNWLMDEGGPVIRYRTAVELAGDVGPADLKRLARELLACPQVRRWLDRLDGVVALHDSGNDRFENVMGKLLEFGLRAGMGPLDEGVARFRVQLASMVKQPPETMGAFYTSILASGLARAGYEDEALETFLRWRVDQLCKLIRKHEYDLYADAEQYPDIPKAFRGRPLVRPELTPGGQFSLPSIHDIYALSALPAGMDDPGTRRKMGIVLRYVLDDAYQSLPEGYGILRAGKRRYLAMGWSVHLPGFRGLDFNDWRAGHFVQRVELMAHFPVATRQAWFRNCLKHLDGFRTDEGTWLFPRRYLAEKKTGYWVTGAHMGLEESRRSSRAMEVESTFRMLRIKHLAGGK